MVVRPWTPSIPFFAYAALLDWFVPHNGFDCNLIIAQGLFQSSPAVFRSRKRAVNWVLANGWMVNTLLRYMGVAL
jgi:hypothetical protein